MRRSESASQRSGRVLTQALKPRGNVLHIKYGLKPVPFKRLRRMPFKLAPLFHGHELERFGTYVVGGRTDDLAVCALLQHVGAPAGGPRDYEQGRKQVDGDPHLVVR